MTENYRAVLPEGFPAGASINVDDARYKAAVDNARAHGLTQDQFSELLGMEARRVMKKAGVPDTAKSSFGKMSFTQQMAVMEAFKAPGGQR